MAIIRGKIGVIGAGAWGTAIACLLAYNDCYVDLWCRNEEKAKQMEETRSVEKYLPGIKLHENIVKISSDLEGVIQGKEFIFLAVPSIAIRDIVSQIKIDPDSCYILCSKGYDFESGKFLTEVMAEYIEKGKIFVLSGPNFAIDIAKGMPSTTSLSYYYHQYRSYESAIEIKKILSSQKMKLHLNSDPMGSQLCGLMKNIYAILIGIIRGSDNDSENTVAMIILEAIKEIKFFLKKMNYDASIIDEPCGIGDLFMTCNSRLSRNMSLGYKIGKGEEIDYSGLMPEGYYAVDIIAKDNLPICKVVHQILYPEKYSEKNDYQTLLNKLYEVL